MATMAVRKIVRIDEAKCDGCGLCIPNCAEGALKIIDGKARLMAENLCDGLGACLGHCPQDAIVVEERPAELFDEAAVQRHLHGQQAEAVGHHAATPQAAAARPTMAPVAAAAHGPHSHGHGGGGCPGSRMRMLAPRKPAAAAPSAAGEALSRLEQWPVQLALVPVSGPMWQDADVLIAADCVPFAYPGFHEKLLAGKRLAIACPKLDDVRPYVQKLAQIFASNDIKSVTVAHMEVPCCGGIVRVVHMALAQAGREDIPVREVTVGVEGSLIAD